MAFVESASGETDSIVSGTNTPLFYEADAQRRALSYVDYTLEQGHGVFLLTGEAGCGKTTLMERVALDLKGKGNTVVSFPAKRVEGRDVFRQVAAEFGLEHYSVPQPELLATLERHLIKCISDGSHPVLIVDDADRLTDGDFAHVIELCDLQSDGSYLLQVVLIGRQFRKLDFVSHKASPSVNHLVASYHMAPLLKDEVEAYFQAWTESQARPELPAMPVDLRDRVYLWSMGRMGRLQQLMETLVLQLDTEAQWDWSEAELERALTTLASAQKSGSVKKEEVAPAAHWRVDQQQDHSSYEPDQPLQPLQAEDPLVDDELLTSEIVVPGMASTQTLSAAVSPGLDTPLVALCADETEAYLLTPLLKALARVIGRCTLLHTNEGLSTGALNWSEGMHSVVRVRPYAAPVNEAVNPAQQLVAGMGYAAECLQGEAVRGLLALNDSDATLALALMAHKRGIPIVRVEAGRRWSNTTHNPNINQMLIDRLADLLLVSDPMAEANLLMEGIPRDRIKEVGTLRIDALARLLAKQGVPFSRVADPARRGTHASRTEYALVTLTDKSLGVPEKLEPLLHVMRDIGELIPVRLLVAPSLREKLTRSSFAKQPNKWNVDFFGGLDPIQSLAAIQQARVVVTDSEFLQAEAAALRIPCITLALQTLWPITVEKGINRLCTLNPIRIIETVSESLAARTHAKSTSVLWDGRTAVRAAKAIQKLSAQTRGVDSQLPAG